jgi:thymidylate synthase (FAD)
LREDASNAYAHYAEMLNETGEGEPADPNRRGLARELARMNLSLNFYTQWYWKIDLHNLLHFLDLRADPHAQYEIRAYADAMLDTVRRWVPDTFEAFMDYGIGGVRLSAGALDVVKRLIGGEKVTQKQTSLSAREWRELMTLLDREA